MVKKMVQQTRNFVLHRKRATRQFIVPSNASSHRGHILSLMGYGGGLLRTQKGRTTWEVFYSGPGPRLPGRRGTRSKEPRNRVSDVGN